MGKICGFFNKNTFLVESAFSSPSLYSEIYWFLIRNRPSFNRFEIPVFLQNKSLWKFPTTLILKFGSLWWKFLTSYVGYTKLQFIQNTTVLKITHRLFYRFTTYVENYLGVEITHFKDHCVLSACTILWCLQFCGGLEPTQSLKGKSIRHSGLLLIVGPPVCISLSKTLKANFLRTFEETRSKEGPWGIGWDIFLQKKV